MKKEKFICPKCSVEGEILDKHLYDGLSAKGETVPLLMVTFECPKCKAVWNEVFIIDYDGYVYNHREYDREGDLLVDWQNEVITEKGKLI